MNCSGLVHKWTWEDRNLIFEKLQISKNLTHRTIGRNYDVALLMFIDIETIKILLKQCKDKTHWSIRSNSSSIRSGVYVCLTEHEFRRARKLLKQVNKYIQGGNDA